MPGNQPNDRCLARRSLLSDKQLPHIETGTNGRQPVHFVPSSTFVEMRDVIPAAYSQVIS